MTGRIPQAFIDELISRADIVDVVGSRVALRKAGRDHQGLCPFHDEKTPSFTVSPAKGFYHCFGCGAHGTAIGFLMSYDNLSFPQAVEALADIVGVPMPRGASAEERPADAGLLGLLKEADQLYRRCLREHPRAIDYLKARGIDGATAGRFGIGYSPDAWDTVLRALGRDEERTARLIEAGLVIRNEQGRCYDRFRDRIMFPIRNPRGDVIGFGGRVLGAGEPKYLNSPETAVFHKGQALYGLFEARRQQGRPPQVVVVEGYLDVASLVQYGIEPAVATLGTATTAEHVRRLTRLTDRVIFCFDGDRAGRAAAWRALETSLPFAGGNVELKFLLLPEGEDPDSLVRAQGADAFRALLDSAMPLSEFMLRELERGVDGSGVDGRARLIAHARPLLARLPAGVYREMLVTELAALAGIEPTRFVALLDAPPRPAGPPSPPAQAPRAKRKSTPIGKTITLVLHYPEAVAACPPVEGLDDVAEPGAALLRQLIETARNNPKVNLAQLLERFRGHPDERHLRRLAAERPPPVDDAGAGSVLHDSLERIVAGHRRRLERQQAIEALKGRATLN